MKRLLTAAIALSLLAWGRDAAAQSTHTTHTESVTKRKGPGPNTKVKTEIVTGKVKEYEPGKKIEIEGPRGKDYDFDLDENATVEGAIVAGEVATVRYTKADDGKEHVVVLSAGAVSGADPHAEHAAETALKTQPATPGSRAHVESTTRRSGPGPDTKTKTEVVVGTVKEFEAGKKITVEGPKNKDYTFDLDEEVAVKGAIAIGQKVRLEYTKRDDGGERVVIIAPVLMKPDSKKIKG